MKDATVKAPAALFFAALLFIGISTYKDYGLSWDEPLQRTLGLYSYEHLTSGDQSIYGYRDKNYGAAFELPLFFAEKALGLTDSRDIYLARHLATFLLFYVSVFFFYLLCRRVFRSRAAGLAGAVFLVMSPRIYADAFYNTKDLAFMAAFIISAYTLVRFCGSKKIHWALAHAVSTAFLADIRIMGLMMPLFTAFIFGIDMIERKNERAEVVRGAASLLLYLALSCSFVVLFWPMVWDAPAARLAEAFKCMGKFPWPGTVLYMGGYIQAMKGLPWHYIPVWIAITTPLAYIAFFVLGCVFSAGSFFAAPAVSLSERKYDIVFLAWFFVPIVMVILLRSVLYDAWRHLFFIYPAFIIIAAGGIFRIKDLLDRKAKRLSAAWTALVSVVIASQLFCTAWFMAANHPYQNLYFNRLAGRDMAAVKRNFDMDYWGLTYRKGLEAVLDMDERGKIRIFGANPSAEYSAMLIEEPRRKRLEFVKSARDAEYFITNYRWHPEEYPEKMTEVYAVKTGNAKVLSVFKLK